jgi:hypothetical protein
MNHLRVPIARVACVKSHYKTVLSLAWNIYLSLLYTQAFSKLTPQFHSSNVVFFQLKKNKT